MSVYTVLRLAEPDEAAEEHGDNAAWEQLVEEVEAPSRQAAIKAATADLAVEQKNGTFVAVLAAEWQPKARTVALTETDSWS